MSQGVFARLHPRLQSAIVQRLGWRSLRPVQDLAGDAILAGRNAVVLAPTAGGKTEASVFPTLSILMSEPPSAVGALYIAPIKALLNNQEARLGRYSEMVGLRRFVWHGDVSTSARNQFLREPAELLMTTPESLEVMLVSTKVDVERLFADLRVVIVDEVHALAGTDRGAHLMSVLERLAARSRHDVQRIGLSATVGNPEDIAAWLDGSSQRGSVVIDPPHEPARRQLLVAYEPELGALAQWAASLGRGQKSLFFCESRRTSEAVARAMERYGTKVFVHHSSVSAEERRAAEDAFHRGKDVCIACTSTLELGIDVGDLDRVLQHEAPGTVSSFMQRMGRTGRRAGAVANTSFFCQTDEAVWVSLALIELAKRRWVEPVDTLDRCWPIVVHQLLAMALAERGVTPEEAWAHFQRVPDVRGIRRVEFDRLVSWMCAQTSLEFVSGRLVLGRRAERRFGKRNFLDLYAVFSSPASYAVEAAGQRPLGSVEQAFVDRLVEGASVFRLGGRGWQVIGIDHKRRVVRVVPSSGGKAPTWSGFGARLLSQPVCAAVEDLLRGTGEPVVAHESALSVLRDSRARFAEVFARGDTELTPKGLTWWTFAGGQINSTLARALNALEPDWKVVTSNFSLRCEGETVTDARLNERLLDLTDPEFWENERLWLEVAETLPDYRLSKFQSLMPPWVQREMVASFLLDVQAAAGWVIEHVAPTPDWSKLAPEAAPEALRETTYAAPTNPYIWVDTEEGLSAACNTLRQSERIGLDVETGPAQELCLVQLADNNQTWVIDPLAIYNLQPLADLMADPDTTKVIHNASFERRQLGRHDIEIVSVIDTLERSRAAYAERTRGFHTLQSVCERELGLRISKHEQNSNWRHRPLTEAQLRYAALDAEILLRLVDAIPDPIQGTLPL